MFKDINQKKYFIIGVLYLIGAVFSITLLPLIVGHFYKAVDENYYRILEFNFIILSAVCYVFSTDYYEYQIASILGAILFYATFFRAYFAIFS